MTDASATAVRDARLTWVLGGSLLIAHAALVLFGGSGSLPVPGLSWAAEALWAAALLMFAFGLRRSGSVVARRPLGVVALAVAAVLPLVSSATFLVVRPSPEDTSTLVLLGQSLAALSLAALVVSTVEVARAGAVPTRLRWVPFIVLCAAAGVQIVLQVVVVSTPSLLMQPDLLVGLFVAAEFVAAAGVLLLGVLAIVFAPREAPAAPVDRTVPVYGPNTSD